MLNKFLTVFLLLTSLLVGIPCQATGTITAARVWPAQDYTRITLESNSPIKSQLIILKNPERLVLDIENVDLTISLKTLSDKIVSSDPYIKQVRVANYKPNIVRIAVDLKGEVRPNLFTLQPAGEYKHRLVLDIYPLQDALMAMLGKKNNDINDALANNEAQLEPSIEPSFKPAQDPIIEPLPPYVGEPSETATEPLTPPDNELNKGVLTNDMPKVEPINNPSFPTNESKKSSDKALDNKLIKPGVRLITIAVDAGHGGEDPGARGASGSREKEITLAIAKKLKLIIDAEPNMRGMLTRDGDFFVPLGTRVVKARKFKADLFISIHADAFTSPTARGSSVFALSEKGATSASARYLAKKENEADLIGGVSLGGREPMLAKTLLDLSQAATINDSLKLGKAVLGHIGEINNLHKSHVEQASFAVLKSPDIPSILVETAFISNLEEERKLTDDSYQDKLAASILSGIKKYFASNPALAKN